MSLSSFNMLSHISLVFILTQLSTSYGQSHTSAPSATIDAGTLIGGICTYAPDAAYFKSIPFAKPPVGNLRFAAPQAYDESYPQNPRNATIRAPLCIQFGGANFFAEAPPNSEDCLFLNIWTSSDFTKTSALPVRVWLYGGFNTAGGISNPAYDGCNVPATNAIMVSLNYRLGPLGYLALESAGIGGNMGIQDILLGLEWVQKNIAAFGGDPDRVMLHGQSAGAFNSFIVATLPQAPKLIKAAVFQSSGGRDQPLKPLAQFLGQSYAKGLDCGTSDINCLTNKTTSELPDVYHTLPETNSYNYPVLALGDVNAYQFGPYVDGKVIPDQPSKVGVRVPSIFGSAAQEGNVFALITFAKVPNLARDVNATAYDTFLRENFDESLVPLIQHTYPISAFNTTPLPAFYAISQVLTDAGFFCPSRRGLNTAIAKGIPVWTYLYNQ